MAGSPAFGLCLTQQAKAGTLLNSFSTAKRITNAEDVVEPSVNYMRVGTTFEIFMAGALSNKASSPGTFLFQMMMGSAIVWSSGNLTFNAASRVLLPFEMSLKLQVVTTGENTAATILGFGKLFGEHITGSQGVTLLPITAPAVGAGFNSSIANRMEMWGGFSLSDALNGIRVDDYNVKQFAF